MEVAAWQRPSRLTGPLGLPAGELVGRPLLLPRSLCSRDMYVCTGGRPDHYWAPSQILALRVYNMPTVSTISRPHLQTTDCLLMRTGKHPGMNWTSGPADRRPAGQVCGGLLVWGVAGMNWIVSAGGQRVSRPAGWPGLRRPGTSAELVPPLNLIRYIPSSPLEYIPIRL